MKVSLQRALLFLVAAVLLVGMAPAGLLLDRRLVRALEQSVRNDLSLAPLVLKDRFQEGLDKVLIRILKPRKEEGTATLKVGSQIWNYLPKIDRTIRVPTSMMMGSWLGSHFTNDDLVKESRLIRDYEIKLEFMGDRDGVQIYEIDLLPHEDAPVVWGRIRYQIRQDDLMPVWARFYDEHGELKRTMRFGDYQMMGNRKVPARMTLVPADHPEELTEMVYRELRFDIAIPRRTFSLGALRE